MYITLIIVVFSIVLLERMRIDDPVGAISVHGTAGIWGILAVLISNEDATLAGQLAGIGAIFGFVFFTSLAVWFVLKKVVGIRVSEEQELEGVDLVECGMQAYPEFVGGHFATSDSPGAGGGRTAPVMPGALATSSSPAT